VSLRFNQGWGADGSPCPSQSRGLDIRPDVLKALRLIEAWVKNGRRALVKMPPPISQSGRVEANRRMTRAAYARGPLLTLEEDK
jgi:hypothetical protein